MGKVLFFNGQPPRAAAMFLANPPAGFEAAAYSSRLKDEEKIALIRDVEYLVLHPAEIAEPVLREAKKLRLIQLLTAGYDKINLKLTEELGLPVATNGGANAWSVAEQTVALLLALYKKIIAGDDSVRRGTWRAPIDGFNTYELAGKTVGIAGAGNIGRKVARRLAGFETDILYYDLTSASDIERDLGAQRVELEELLRRADIISLHLPLFPDTRGLINGERFSLMKETAVLLNTGRAEVVEEQALVKVLQEKRIQGAGLDVFHQEPIDPNHPLLRLDNVVLSPHVAGHGYEGWGRRFRFAWDNIQAMAAGKQPESLVTVQ